MTTALLFWILMLIWLLLGAAPYFHAAPGSKPWPTLGASLIVWCTVALLGWRVFGAAVHG